MIKERVLEFIDFKKDKKEEIFCKLGMSGSNFRSNQRKTGLNSDTIAKFFSIYPDINLEWLITGKGEMQKESSPSEEPPEGSTLKALLDKIVELSAENGALKAQLEEAKKRNDETKSA